MNPQSITKQNVVNFASIQSCDAEPVEMIRFRTDFAAASGKALGSTAAREAQFGASFTVAHIAEAGSRRRDHRAADFSRTEARLPLAAASQIAVIHLKAACPDGWEMRRWMNVVPQLNLY